MSFSHDGALPTPPPPPASVMAHQAPVETDITMTDAWGSPKLDVDVSGGGAVAVDNNQASSAAAVVMTTAPVAATAGGGVGGYSDTDYEVQATLSAPPAVPSGI